MFLKNYTSNVLVSQTIYRIEQVLIKCGVVGIAKEYTGASGEISAITFRINDNGKEFNVRLPADKEKAQEALWRDYGGNEIHADGLRMLHSSRKRLKRSDFAQQAERTAWKIIQDWIEVQMSMIQMRQADSVEVFMPYIWDGKQTVYNRVKDGGYRMLLPETT